MWISDSSILLTYQQFGDFAVCFQILQSRFNRSAKTSGEM
jgi:hypothetical protein